MRKRDLLSLVLLFLISMTAQGCKSSSSSNAASQATLDLSGSKQGQAVAFVDLDGDGIADKIVGAPYSSTTSAQTGAVLVYKGNATGYSAIPDMVLTGDDNMGYSIINLGDVDGDGNADLAVSALHGDGADVSLSGSVTIYKGGGSGQVIKKVSGEGPMDKFGYSLAVGDLNGDGKPDLIVGAPFNTNDLALYQSGAVYVFFGPDFTTEVKLYASSTNKGLGLAIAAGDVNNDGKADLLISASGKVLAYYGASSFGPAIDAPNIKMTSTVTGFGKAIAVIGDLDNDGTREIAIGAPNAVISSNRDTGSVYIIKGTATGTVGLDDATAPTALMVRIDGGGLFSRFGSAIAALDDIDGDGKPDFAVGAPMADVTTDTGDTLLLSGKVYLFKGKDLSSSTTLASASVFSGKVENQSFGLSLAGSNGRLLIGGPRADSDFGSVNMVDMATGQMMTSGGSGGAVGGTSDCCY